MDHLARLQEFFRSLFQFDLADLDFGLYRLFRIKQDEIEAFITAQLPREVDAAFAEVSAGDKEYLEREIERLTQQIQDNLTDDAILPGGEIAPAYADTRVGRAYTEARRKLRAIEVTEGHKAEVFNHLVTFFSRYYEEGDFIPRRRYGARETYAVPYRGEEVFFHWANRDQHYVKTHERFLDYAFTVRDLTGAYRVRFTIAAASVPRDNTKGSRRYFFPRPDSAAYDADSRAFTLPFEYRLPTPEEADAYGSNSQAQEAILEEAVPHILEAVPDENLRALLGQDQRTEQDVADGKPETPLLLRRLRHFCRRNTSDYFIHRDLRGFLTRELEFYVKDQVLHLMDLEADLDAKRRVVRTFRRLAERVIDFLAAIEEAQKTLFEKHKFVLGVDYLIPIQHVPRRFWAAILGNQAQLDEWRDWGMLDQQADLFNHTGGVNDAFLEAHPTLPLHTAHFDRAFVQRLLEALPFDDLDDATDGLLVHSENYQALRLLEERYREQVKSIYIDPPYNTDASPILYKNGYKHSSWLSLIENRIVVAKRLLTSTGVLCCAIDDEEVSRIRLVFEALFPKLLGIAVVRSNPQSRKARGKFSPAHEYALFFGLSAESVPGSLSLSDARLARYPLEDEKGRFAWLNFIRTGTGDRREDRPKLYYPIFVAADGSLRVPKMTWSPTTGNYGEYILHESPRDDETVVYPIIEVDGNIVEKRWHRGAERVLNEPEEFRVRRDKNGKLNIDFKTRMDTAPAPTTWWSNNEYASANYGAAELKALFGYKPFDFPKALSLVTDCLRAANADSYAIVLDFFAGSGTTGHAVINLNREDGGRRKFILVEMGEYFDTVLLPRIAKVMYAPEWKDGRPKRAATSTEAERTPRLVKVLRLESYEDALHNLVATAKRMADDPAAQRREAAYKELAGADAYRLHYLIELPLQEAETCLRVLDLAHPFAYTLEILTDEGPVRQPVDVVETFNYLYGLRVRRTETWRNPQDGDRVYRVVKAGDREGKRRILVIWRDMGDGHDPESERAFLEGRIAAMAEEGEVWDEVLINGDTPTPGVASLDPLFKRLMMAGESA